MTITTPSAEQNQLAASAGTVPKSGLRAVWRRYAQNKLAVFGLFIVVLLVLCALFADVIAPYGFKEQIRGAYHEPPSRHHWLGTDKVGRDVLSRIIYGSRISLKVGILATLISLVIGTVFGAISGFFGGVVDALMMRFVDIFLAIPYVILAVSIATVFGRSVNSLIVVLGVTGWLSIARVVRASFLGLRNLEYTEAARALGFSKKRIIFGHLLPNASVPIIVYGTIAVGGAILSEAAFSFIGVGPQRPTPAWGLMVAEAGAGSLTSAPHMLLFPGLAIFFTVLGFVLVGDGLRDTLDPKMRR
jgi:peptide/nickel transport system permease protein